MNIEGLLYWKFAFPSLFCSYSLPLMGAPKPPPSTADHGLAVLIASQIISCRKIYVENYINGILVCYVNSFCSDSGDTIFGFRSKIW